MAMVSDLPTPKYRIGDIVYRPQIDWTIEKLPCPDCLGERVWHVTTPSGVTHLLDCPRCSDRYSIISDKLPLLQVRRYQASVQQIQIGSVQARTDRPSYSDRITYMTSVTGSGTVYGEGDLYPTHEAALAMAEMNAALKNAEVDRTAAALTARRFSNLPLADAITARLRDSAFESWHAFRQLADLIIDLLPEDANDDDRTKIPAADLRRELDRLVRGRVDYPGVYAMHPIDALLVAIDSGDSAGIAAAAGKLKALL